MIVSCNEIETLVLKAARGAGFPWGLAEEAAVAARWLAERGVDGLAPLAALFDRPSGASNIEVGEGEIRPVAGAPALCPLHVGAYIADLSGEGLPVTIRGARHPILLLPFVAAVSSRAGCEVAFSFGSAKLAIGAHDIEDGHDHLDRLAACRVADVVLSHGRPRPFASRAAARLGPVAVDPQLWRRLSALEARTYVAASLRSRTAGAGAGLTDSD